MTNNPYQAAEFSEAKRTFEFTWWRLGVAVFFAVLFSTSVAVAEKYFQLWTYISRAELARSLAGFPPNGGVLPPVNELLWAIVSTVCIVLPYSLPTLLLFVPLFLWLCRPRPGRSE